MAKEAVDFAVLLRQIQETQAEHGRLLSEISKRLDEVRVGVILALGLAKSADIDFEALRRELDEARGSVEKPASHPDRYRVLDDLMQELENLPPDELRRQIEAANVALMEKPSWLDLR